MGYKEKLGLIEEEVTADDSGFIFNKEVDEYFMNQGFYLASMSPRFFGEETNAEHITEPDKSCLRFDKEVDEGGIMRVFINRHDFYMETQTAWRSLGTTQHESTESLEVSIKGVEALLEELLYLV